MKNFTITEALRESGLSSGRVSQLLHGYNRKRVLVDGRTSASFVRPVMVKGRDFVLAKGVDGTGRFRIRITEAGMEKLKNKVAGQA